MNAPTRGDLNGKPAHPAPERPATPRMSAKVRKAVALIATEGKTVNDAARGAGMNPSALSRALHRPGMQEYLEEQKAQFCLEVDQLKGQVRRVAILEGLSLLKTAKSEAVKARMVEFFAGDPKAGTSVNVTVNAGGQGYEYVSPGQKLVDITPADDSQSGNQGEEGE